MSRFISDLIDLFLSLLPLSILTNLFPKETTLILLIFLFSFYFQYYLFLLCVIISLLIVVWGYFGILFSGFIGVGTWNIHLLPFLFSGLNISGINFPLQHCLCCIPQILINPPIFIPFMYIFSLRLHFWIIDCYLFSICKPMNYL